MNIICQACGATVDAAELHTFEDCQRVIAGRVEYSELVSQPYTDAVFSAGFVTGHPVDTVYLRLERDGEEPLMILLRPDELAAVAWLATSVLWSHEMAQLAGQAGKGGV